MTSVIQGGCGAGCPISLHERVVQHSVTANGATAAAPDTAAAVGRGTATTTRPPLGPPPSGTAPAGDGAARSGTASTSAHLATMRLPASTSIRSPGRSRAATAASAIRIGSFTGSGDTRGTAPVAGPRGTGSGCRVGAWCATADTASAAAVAARAAARVLRLRRTARRSRRRPPRRPTLIGGNKGTSQRGGVYGRGAESPGERQEPPDGAAGLRDGEVPGEGKETDVDMRNTA